MLVWTREGNEDTESIVQRVAVLKVRLLPLIVAKIISLVLSMSIFSLNLGILSHPLELT